MSPASFQPGFSLVSAYPAQTRKSVTDSARKGSTQMGKIEAKVTFQVLSDMFPSSCSPTVVLSHQDMWQQEWRTRRDSQDLDGQGRGTPSNKQDQPSGVPLLEQRYKPPP